MLDDGVGFVRKGRALARREEVTMFQVVIAWPSGTEEVAKRFVNEVAASHYCSGLSAGFFLAAPPEAGKPTVFVSDGFAVTEEHDTNYDPGVEGSIG